MKRRLIVLFLLFMSTVHASIFCPHTAYPSKNDEFVVGSIQSRQRPGHEAYYRISDDIDDPVFQRKSSRFRMMLTRDSKECPFRGCLVELSPVEPKNHGTILYQTSVIGKMIPPGFFAMDVPKRLYCVITDGDCGATIPIYRHFRFSATGIYHAYSLDADEVIEGYSREPTPLCYVWPKDKPPTPPSQVSDTQSTLIPPLTDIIDKLLKPSTSQPESSSSHSNEDNALIDSEELCQGAGRRAFDSSMKKLKEYHNGETGAKSDHLYTTRKPDNAYKQQAVLGKVITDAKKTNCKCLVQLAQMKFESDDKNVLDHKLVRTQIEPISLYQYQTTGEEFYCAPREGACGATVPLRKFYNLADSDSMMTAGSETAPPNTTPYPSEIICWIWSKNYHQDSTEEELRKENMNVIQPPKSGEEASETVEGSGVEVQQQKLEKKIAKDEPKIDPQPPPAPMKSKKGKKSKAKKKKPAKVGKDKKKEPSKVTDTDATTVPLEQTEGGDKIIRFEAVATPKESKQPEPTGDIKPEIKPTGDKGVLNDKEEKVRELAKFENKHTEPIEIKQQQDEEATVVHFEDVLPKQKMF